VKRGQGKTFRPNARESKTDKLAREDDGTNWVGRGRQTLVGPCAMESVSEHSGERWGQTFPARAARDPAIIASTVPQIRRCETAIQRVPEPKSRENKTQSVQVVAAGGVSGPCQEEETPVRKEVLFPLILRSETLPGPTHSYIADPRPAGPRVPLKITAGSGSYRCRRREWGNRREMLISKSTGKISPRSPGKLVNRREDRPAQVRPEGPNVQDAGQTNARFAQHFSPL